MAKVETDIEAMLAFEGPEGPFAMLNLFRLKDKSQFAEFQQAMAAAVSSAMAAVGARPLYAGAVGGEFVAGTDEWDLAILVQYPDWKALRAMVSDPEAGERVNQVRKVYLADSRLILTTPLDG